MSVRRRRWNTTSGGRRTAWVADFVDLDGDRHLKTFRTQTAALAYHADVLNGSRRRPLARVMRRRYYAQQHQQAERFARILGALVDVFLLDDLPGVVMRDLLLDLAAEDFTSRRRGLLKTPYQVRSRREILQALISSTTASVSPRAAADDRAHMSKDA